MTTEASIEETVTTTAGATETTSTGTTVTESEGTTTAELTVTTPEAGQSVSNVIHADQ